MYILWKKELLYTLCQLSTSCSMHLKWWMSGVLSNSIKQYLSVSIYFAREKGYHENIIGSKFIMHLVFLTPQELGVGEILKKKMCYEIPHFEFLFLWRLINKAYWFCYYFPSLSKGKKSANDLQGLDYLHVFCLLLNYCI